MTEETNNKAQYCVAFAVALATMSASAAFSWTTPVIPKFHSNETTINLTDTEISWLVVSVSPGLMLGSLTSQVLSDNAGRRPTIIASAIPLCTGTIFILFSSKVWMFYVARFLWGIGVGMIQTVTTMYLTEIASKEIRGTLAIGNRFMFNFGGFSVIAIGSFVTYQNLSYMLIVLPVTYTLVCWWIPESPYYLLKEEKVDRAKNVLARLNGRKDEKIIEPKFAEMRKHVKEDMKRSATVKELFTGKRYRKALIIAFGLRTFQIMSGSIALQQYVGRIMQDTESSLSLTTGLILFAALRLFISMLASGIVDRVGRRPLLIYSFTGSSITLAIIGTCSFINEVLVDNYTVLFGNIVIFGIVCLSILSTIGYDTVVHLVAPEIFPLNVKSIAMTCTNLYVGVITFVAIRGYQVVMDLAGLYGVFWFFGAGCFAGAVFSYAILPETKGKSLREIQMELQGSLYEQQIENIETKKEDAETVLITHIK